MLRIARNAMCVLKSNETRKRSTLPASLSGQILFNLNVLDQDANDASDIEVLADEFVEAVQKAATGSG